MPVWRRSLICSQRNKMFSVAVSWTNNKDPTSDKGIWLFGTEWEAQCSTRGCPSLTEPFSTLGTDIKAASTPLKYSHIHRHKGRHARTHTHTCMHAHTTLTHKTQEVCLSRTCGEGRQRKQLSVEGNKKNNSWKGVCIREGECETKALAPSKLISLQREMCKGCVREKQPYEHCHCPPEHNTEGTASAEREPGARETVFHINRDAGRLAGFKHVLDTGIHSCPLTW